MCCANCAQALYKGDDAYYEACVVRLISYGEGGVEVTYLGYRENAILKNNEVRKAPPLPPQWEEAIDTASGFPYWTHSVTGESQWQRPSVAASTPPPTKAGPLSSAVMPRPSRTNASSARQRISGRTNQISAQEFELQSSRSSSSTGLQQLPPIALGSSRRGSGSRSSNSSSGTIISGSRESAPARAIREAAAAQESGMLTVSSGSRRGSRSSSNNSGSTSNISAPRESAAARAIREAAAAPGAFSMAANGTRVPNVNSNALTLSRGGGGGRNLAVPGAFGRPMRRDQQMAMMLAMGGGCGCGVAGC